MMNMNNSKKELSPKQIEDLLNILKIRFEKNANRHPGLEWKNIETKLKNNTSKILNLFNMENSGGEPDIIDFDKKSGEYIFYDCSPESPQERRSLCYDHKALEQRKENKPKNSAINMAKEMGVEILTEDEYKKLQSLGEFDLKTSSWIKTPDKIRDLGGAVFADYRYKNVFVYHNGADSYYASRGFRSKLIL
jgi:hypothetical protein